MTMDAQTSQAIGIIILGVILAYGIKEFIVNVLHLIWQLKDRARVNGRSITRT